MPVSGINFVPVIIVCSNLKTMALYLLEGRFKGISSFLRKITQKFLFKGVFSVSKGESV